MNEEQCDLVWGWVEGAAVVRADALQRLAAVCAELLHRRQRRGHLVRHPPTHQSDIRPHVSQTGEPMPREKDLEIRGWAD